ncbi:Uncharacterized conserved protein YkwD, contains CAP (CSP/antigen 5/PR1) domain [Cognatiyoonia koreensis]|uniref:Uncharacterized conserved protein YkwD, contains CAP (CSP/antigen 5/PR1) domain n=1 Tax=Cognatiyoonia koreensis TaxID=364200 RepID=A0A1I0QSA1_9RHOB|nr:CAP domain-containing protein [Cognatiyoonia koreensis]SEW30179.1 Uncharacterized conserved protein YkwD, contains CAP (CSP/antigen 5/PR1) domain [Cognatiyoonia koreensis]
MKPVYSVALLATLAACGGTSISENVVSSGGSLASPTTTIPAVAPVPDTAQDASFADLLNGVRRDNGADDVTYNAQLNTAAQRHADDMLENDYFSHTGLNGSSVGQRVQAAGYNFRRVGENIAAGYQTETSVLDGWVNSPGHQRNNIDPNFEEFGLGFARDGQDTRWVLVLGTEQ